MAVTNTSLLRYCKHYCHKKFYSTGPRGQCNKRFMVVTYGYGKILLNSVPLTYHSTTVYYCFYWMKEWLTFTPTM